MDAAEADLRFPVLMITKVQGVWAGVWAAPSLDILTLSGRGSVRDGLQNGMEIFDLEGRRFVVGSVREVRPDRPLLSWLLWVLLAGRQYRLSLELEPLQPLALDALKQKVCDTLEAHADYWTDGQEPNLLLPRLLAEVAAATDIRDIHSALCADDLRTY